MAESLENKEPKIDLDRIRETSSNLTWTEAIDEARAQIAWHERRIRLLHGAIATFAQLQREGWKVPWVNESTRRVQRRGRPRRVE